MSSGGTAVQRSSDFGVGDVVSLTNKRQGTIKWIGTIDGIGTPCFGIELKEGSKPLGKPQDGEFNGQKYFECEAGRGTFVARAKIISRIKAAEAKAKKGKNKTRGKNKSPRPNGAKSSARTGKKSPRPNGTASASATRGGRKKDGKKGKKSKSQTPKKGGATVSFNIPENGTTLEKIDFILDKLKDTKSQFKGRQKMCKSLSEIMETEEKMDESVAKHCVEGFRKPFQTQLAGKRVTIHKAVMETLVSIAKAQNEVFTIHAAFYVKKLVGHCKHSDPKSVQAAEKTIQTIIKETKEKSTIAATLIQAAAHAKNKIVRKHAWKFLNEALKYYLPAKGQAANPPTKDILDALAAGLKTGLAESDKHTKEEAMHVLNTLGLLDETRAERLISKLPTAQKRQYQSKFLKRTSSKSKITGLDKKGAGTKGRGRTGDKGKKPTTANGRAASRGKGGKGKKDGGKAVGKGAKGKGASKTPRGGRGVKSPTGKGRDGKGKKGNGKGTKTDTKVTTKGKGKGDGAGAGSPTKKEDNKETGATTTTKAKGKENDKPVAGEAEKAKTDATEAVTSPSIDDSEEDDTELSDEVKAKRAERKSRGRNGKGSLMGGSEDDDQLTAALKIEFPGLGDGSAESDDNPFSPDESDTTDTEDKDLKKLDVSGDDEDDDSEDMADAADVEENVGGDDGDESSSTSSSTDEPLTQDPNTAIELIESFLELKDPQINWKMIEFLSKDNMTHLLMSYISRMPGGPKIWTENLDVDFDEVIPPTKPLSSEEETEIRATRLSYSLMRILSNEHAAETVKSFLLRKCQEICLHALAVFHPRSKGNVYHGRVVLEILLNDWPKSFMGALANQKHIQKLLKCALFRNLHQGNLNSFFLDLICYRPNPKTAQLQPIKRKLLKLFSDWQFMEYLLDAACSPKHGDDVATKYATFFIDLVARSASIPEAAELFHGNEHLIIDSFMNALLDDDSTRTLWHRIICGQTLVQFLDISSRPNIMDPAAAMAGVMGIMPEPSPNVLHLMFEKSLERLHTFIPRMCKAIQFPKEKLTPITLSGGVVDKPFGQVRLNCLELLTVSADFAQFGCGKVLGKLTNEFWKAILDMAFIHETNNMYLCHFRRLIHLSMIFRRRFLKYLFVECNMLERFVEFYQTPNKNRATLHGYILQMLWDIYHHDQRDDDDQKLDDNENDNDGKDDDNDSNSSVIVNDGDKPKEDDSNENDNDNNDDKGESPKKDNDSSSNKDNDDSSSNKNEDNDDNTSDDSPPTLDGLNGEDKKDEDEYTEEDLILRPNFSRDPEDQWDIVSFFKSNESWKSFEKILTQEIEIQNNADTQLPNPMGAGGDGQLDALLQNLLGPSNGDGGDDDDDDDGDDSSSDDSSDDD